MPSSSLRVMRLLGLLLPLSRGLSTSNSVANATRRWVERVVVGKKLCPWANAVQTTMRISVLQEYSSNEWKRGNGAKQIALTDAILTEAIQLSRLGPQHTTLVVLPNFSDCFDTYLEVTSAVEGLLEAEQLASQIQVASFHPLYLFQDSSPDDPSNYSNRSPYPIVHLLKAPDVTEAIRQWEATGQSTDSIWSANIEKMRRAGVKALSQLLEDIKRDS